MSYEYELDEWRNAVGNLNELERARNCGHSAATPRDRDCPDCGEARD